MSKITLTKKEKEEYGVNEETLREFLLAKAILSELRTHEFEEAEKVELSYITDVEKVKFYIAKRLEGRINVTEETITEVYTANKKYFDDQKIAFTEARDIIGQDLVNQQVQQLENEEIFGIVNEMENNVELTKQEILYSNGDPTILRVMVTNKVVLKKSEKSGFNKENRKILETIENNVLVNYYIDSEVRKVVRVTQEEIQNEYNNQKENLKNIPSDQAYQEVTNNLLMTRATEERTKIINEISRKYKVEDVVKENFEEK